MLERWRSDGVVLKVWFHLYLLALFTNLQRLCKEYEFIASRALTTPANTGELVELIEYVKKTQATTMGDLYQVSKEGYRKGIEGNESRHVSFLA